MDFYEAPTTGPEVIRVHTLNMVLRYPVQNYVWYQKGMPTEQVGRETDKSLFFDVVIYHLYIKNIVLKLYNI